MKKTIMASTALFALGAAITLYSCQKEATVEQQPTPVNELNVSAKANRLVFATVGITKNW